jgi:hypothetical protein
VWLYSAGRDRQPSKKRPLSFEVQEAGYTDEHKGRTLTSFKTRESGRKCQPEQMNVISRKAMNGPNEMHREANDPEYSDTPQERRPPQIEEAEREYKRER